MKLFHHSTLGFCTWDLVALLVLLALLGLLLWHIKKQKKWEKELEERLAAKMADESLSVDE